jgi:hypothetical protein
MSTTQTDPATKGDLQLLKGDLQGDMQLLKGDLQTVKSDLRGEIQASAQQLRDEMRAMEKRLLLGIADAVSHALRVAAEQLGRQVDVVEEKYAALPEALRQLRHEVDEHVADKRIHRRPAAVAPKRAKKPQKGKK